MKDYYEILNINRDATEEEIEEAYQKLVKEYHSDEHSSDTDRIEYFEKIEEAYLTLSNSDKKYVYDQELLDHAAELVWTLRQLNVKEKKSPFQFRTNSKLWTVIASFIIIGIALYLFTILDEPRGVTFQSKRNDTEKTGNNFAATSDNQEGETLEAPQEEESDNAESATNEENTPDRSNRASSRSDAENTDPASAGKTKTSSRNSVEKLNSLQDYFKAIGSENRSYEEKAAMIDDALDYFEDRNTNVLIIGSNEVQTRRETIQNYLDIVMIQSYKVTVIESQKNNNGKITQISVKESL